jgi:hypothetical protein
MFKKILLIYGGGVIAMIANVITIFFMAAPFLLVWKLVF